MTQATVQVTGIEVHIKSSSEKEGYFSGNYMVLNGSVPMYFTVELPSLHCEVPQNMGSVLVKKTRVVALNFFGHKFQLGMQDIGVISTAVVFIVQIFFYWVVDAHPEVECT